MDLFGFEEGGDNKFTINSEHQALVDNAIRKYRKSTMAIMVIFGIIILLLNILIVPYIFDERLEARISEIELSYEKLRSLPDNYSMVGVEVGAASINCVVEVNCSTNSGYSSAGSGFVINNDGYVLTNAHVVTYEKGTFFSSVITVFPVIRCNFYNNTNTYLMEMINYDLTLDLAILKFKSVPEDLQAVVFGNSDHLNLGEEVVAIGNAEGLGLSLTVGVVSTPLKEFRDGTKAIQTDAAINPGNSGGPLFNIFSELVGVTTFKIVDTEANEGMGFAIPSNVAKEFIEKTAKDNRITIEITLSENF